MCGTLLSCTCYLCASQLKTYFLAVTELRLEPPGEDVDKLVLESLFEVCFSCTLFVRIFWVASSL